MKRDFGWINGVSTLCHCGRVGIWGWEFDKDQFVVWHDVNDRCFFKTITKREEQMLRRLRGRKVRY